MNDSVLPRLTLLALVAVGASLVGSAAAAPDAASWAVQGSLSDACQCTVFCACELAEKPTFGHCNDTAIIHVDRGHYGEVDLSGHRIVIVSKSPEGERLVDTVGRLDFAHMYVPDEASPEQAAALQSLARRIFGSWNEGHAGRISENETLERVPMEVSIAPRRHRVVIPDTLELDIEALTGWDGENPVTLHNGPAAGPGQEAILVAKSRVYRYTGHGIDWNYGGRSASMRSIDMSGPID